MTNPTPLTADRILPGDVIRNHPDTLAPGEWTVTAIHHIDPDRRVRLDYTRPDGTAGCFVVGALDVVVATKGNGCPWLNDLTGDEMRQMLCYLAGWSREGMAAALADTLRTRDRLAAWRERNEAVSA